MKRKINKVKIFSNDNSKSIALAKKLKRTLSKNNILIDEENPDLAIAIGGDGTFLKMINKTKFNKDIIYVGINTGTLGFAQEYENVDNLINDLNNNLFKLHNLQIQKNIIETKDRKTNLYSLNEIAIRDIDLNTMKSKVYIDKALLENFTGDGILISTAFGSTAYNLSFGGSIIYHELDVIELTPIAPLNNKHYKTLFNSVILPDNKEITIKPIKYKNILVTLDGHNHIFNDVVSIKTKVLKDKIKVIRLKNYNFAKKINDKFLK